MLGSALWASAASAAPKSFSFPPQAAVGFDGASVGSTVVLPGAGDPDFFISFVIPQDYQADRELKVVLYLSNTSVSCTARLVATQLVRRRLNAPAANSTSGLNGGAPTVDFSSSGAIVGKGFRLSPGSAMPGQRRGDSITLQFERQADDPTDTCAGNVFVHAIDVRYPTP